MFLLTFTDQTQIPHGMRASISMTWFLSRHTCLLSPPQPRVGIANLAVSCTNDDTLDQIPSATNHPLSPWLFMVFDGLFLCLGIYGNEICFFFFYCKKWQLSRLIKRGLSFSSRWSWSASFFYFSLALLWLWSLQGYGKCPVFPEKMGISSVTRLPQSQGISPMGESI